MNRLRKINVNKLRCRDKLTAINKHEWTVIDINRLQQRLR